jgi:RNA polymerase sigma-70 factor (ECF subfamily)
MQNLSDAELVALYKESKDQQYLTTLFTRHSDIVYRSALRIMKNTSDAEDIMQTGYCKMIRDLHLYNGKGSVLGWMIQVIIHTCYQQKNSEKSRLNREKKMMSERTTSSEPKNNELSEMVENHLNKLPEIYKVPITLQIMEGLSIKEVSQVLEIPEKTIRSQIARGLDKLKISLQSVGFTASIVSISDMLKEIQQPLAPEAIKSSQYFQSVFQAKTALSAKIAVTSAAKGFVFQKTIAMGLLIIFAVSGLFFWQSFSKSTSLKAGVPGHSQNWDFENTKDLNKYQDIGLLSGAIHIEASRGVNNSNALMVAEQSLIEFDISKYQLPIKISYVTDIYMPTNDTDSIQMFFKGNCVENKVINHIFGLRERVTVQQSIDNPQTKLGYFGKWFSHVVYIEENFIDFYVNGKRSHLLFCTSKDNKKVYLFAGKSIIDDIVVESIDKQQLPKELTVDKVEYTTAMENGVLKTYPNKEKLGLEKNSTAKPFIITLTAEAVESMYGLKNEAIYPVLSSLNKVEWVEQKQKISKKWNFENTSNIAEYQEVGLVTGGITIVESMGENSSNGLVVDSETLIEFDISRYQLPLRISYKMDPLKASAGMGQIVLKSNYLPNKPLLHLSDLSERIQLPDQKNNLNSSLGFTGQWYLQECYISEEFVDLWIDGKPSHFIKGVSTGDQKVFLYVKGQSIIDDLKIESISKKDLPDHGVYEGLIAKIKFQKDVDRYFLDKEKLGFDKNSEVKPILEFIEPQFLEKSLHINEMSLHPIIGASKKVEWTKTPQKVSRNWSFESNELDGIKLIFGKAVVAPSQGINKTNCLFVEAKTLLEFDISGFELPLKIEHSFDSNLPVGKEGEGILFLKGNYEVQKNIFNFNKCSNINTIDISEKAKKNKNENVKLGYFGEWFKRTIFVSDDCIDVWLNGKRSGLIFGKSYDNKKLYFYVKDQTIFDNFEIKSVAASEIPDHSAFNKMVEKVPFKTGFTGLDLESEKTSLGINTDRPAKLDIFDKFTLEKSLGIRKNPSQNASQASAPK